MRTATHVAALSFPLLSLVLGGCSEVRLAPPAAPAREIPKGVESRRLPPDTATTRVLLDANGAHAKVLDIVDETSATATVRDGMGSRIAYGHAETSKPICITPCFADLKPGTHVLRFIETDGRRTGGVDLQVNDNPKAVRHAFGDGYTSHEGTQFAALMMLILGGTALLGGLAMLPVALQTNDREGPSALRAPTFITLGAGAALALASIPLLIVSRTTYQPGATTEFPLER